MPTSSANYEAQRDAIQNLGTTVDGPYTKDQPGQPESSDFAEDLFAKAQFVMDQYWVMKNLNAQDEDHEAKDSTPPATHRFKSAEEFRAYIKRLKETERQVVVPANPKTPVLDLSGELPLAEAQQRDKADLESRIDNIEDTKIQSIMDQLSMGEWDALSEAARMLIDSVVVSEFGQEKLKSVKERKIAAGMILGEVTVNAKDYHEWLLKTTAEIFRHKFKVEPNMDRIKETCRVLLFQEVDAELVA